MPDAWIVPKNGTSVLWVRPDATHYRNAERPLLEKGPVPMPPRAVSWLDITRDLLVYVHEGVIHVRRGLFGQAPDEILKIPGKPQVHALEVVDDVVFVGADAGKSMLGFLDLRAPLRWQGIDVKPEVNWAGKGIDGFAVRGSRLIAIDDIVVPRYLIVLDVKNPRAPQWIEHRDLPAHSSYERVRSVVSNGEIAALFSTSANHGAFALHIAFLNLETLEEYAALSVQGSPSYRKWAERSYDFHGLALQGNRVLIAAGADGIGILPVPPIPSETPPKKPKRFMLSGSPRLSEENLSFVAVPSGPVVGVIAVDETQAFAIVEGPAQGIFKQKAIDSVLVPLPPIVSA